MFTHLHLHTEYSLLDGACTIDRLVDRLVELGQTSCAITDHGVMYGVVDFYQKCRKKGIHPVIGSEVYVCANMLDKTAQERDYSHLILLCENQTGYKNLSKLVSCAFIDGFYYRPRVDYDCLRKYSEGLICLSACLSGDIPKLILSGRYGEAGKMARMYEEIYGKGNFFIELQDHHLPEDKQVLPGLIRLANELDIPLVVTNDCHYINRDDAQAQEVLMCIQTGKTLSDESRMKMKTDELYVKSEEEMRQLFPDFDDAFENTCLIANRCNVEFDFETRHLPRFPLDPGQNAMDFLKGLCREGLEKRYPGRKDAAERLDYELGVIEKMGFADYFLIVWDFIRYARENGILVGPGRGSGAGSIVAYSLGITSIDPLKYNLLFERFLNPERVSMPDLDIDFDYERRGEVIEYVARRYGHDHVAQIITFGTMAAKGVIRDVGRVLGMTYQQTDVVAKMVPFALDMTLDKAMSINNELRLAYENDPAVQTLIDTAKKLEGMPRHASTHAAGVLITSKPVSDYVPLQTNDDVITTQFPMGTLEALGLLKMDFLGLRTLTVIGDSLKMIATGTGREMTPEDIPLDDPEVYSMIASGDTDGVFQLESSGMRSFLMNMKPENFEDIIAAISLYRPGPMESIPRYIECKRNPEKVTYADERLKPILSVTYGCMVYQEQVMQIVRDLAGYSLGRSDLVRRAMSKKKHDVMAREKEYFINGKLDDEGNIEVPGAVRNGIPAEVAERLFEEMTAFASYAFNKSHAAAYGVVAVQTAWLKVHYKVEFMAAMMNSVTGNSDKVAFYIQYCRKNDIKVLPPDINRSGDKFTVDEGAIRFGLGAVKNVGHGAVAALTSQRDLNGPYIDLFDFIDRVPEGVINKRCVESLIKAGALDSLPGHRAQKMAAFEPAMDASSKSKKKTLTGQVSMFDMLNLDEEEIKPVLPQVREYPSRLLLSMEKEMTGVYISGHPLDEYRKVLDTLKYDYQKLTQFCEEADHGLILDGVRTTIGGLIAQVNTKATKSGSIMAFVQLEDLYGTIEGLVFPKVYDRIVHKLEVNKAVLATGKLSIREDEPPKILIDSIRGMDENPDESENGFDYAISDTADDKAPVEIPECMRERRFSKPDATPDARVLCLRLDDDDQLEQAAKILMPTPGLIRVVFVIGEEKRRYDAPRNLWIGEDYAEELLKETFGEERVVMINRKAG
ncbi:MAG: DNA polymerase III subunit alpha [Clostridia bacterium]|nr:DNA polymerase III subunit alpha [Clostridia bacterium]